MKKKPKTFIWQGQRRGGAERIMKETADFLQEEYRIEPDIGMFDDAIDPDSNFNEIGVKRWFSDRFMAYNIILASWFLRGRLPEYDLVLTHSGGFWGHPDNFYVYREPADLNQRLKALSFFSKVNAWLPINIARSSLKGSDLPIAASQRAEHFFEDIGVKEYISSVNFLEPSELPKLAPKGHSANEQLNVTFVGRDAPIKNLALLKRVVSRIDSVHLHIFGSEGSDGHQVTYHGWVEEEELNRFLAQKAHLFILPSRAEGMSLSLLKALACGVPTIVSEGAMLSEYQDTLLLFQSESELRDLIGRAKNDYEHLQKQFIDLAEIVRKKHDKKRVLSKEFDEIFKRMGVK